MSNESNQEKRGLTQTPWGIHWFRRDLRIAGNPALRWNWKKTQGRTLGLFLFDSKFLARADFSHNRFAFFLKTLQALQDEMREIGGDLLVLNQGPEEGFQRLFSKWSSAPPNFVSFNRDYEPFARERDAKQTEWLLQRQVEVHTERDHLVFEPHELTKDGPGSFYQIYTPFSKKWFAQLQSSEAQERVKLQKESLHYLQNRAEGKRAQPILRMKWEDVLPREVLHSEPLRDSLKEFIQNNTQSVTVAIPEGGSLAAFAKAKEFEKKLSRYLEDRDFPEAHGTSNLSIYFKNGSITTSTVTGLLGLTQADLQKKNGPAQFLKELIWREFYYHILFHRPNVEKEAFLAHTRQIQWENNPEFFERWKEGTTGFPIVDAGMRELRQTGLMHNRVRMIVASFLTKDLLIDWRWGEQYFMNQLLDGDLAPNNGGWQWAASTGCDPQPYFRIFNPELQSMKFDPKGEYIKKYVPELRHVSADEIHTPGSRYITPIVNHAAQKPKALALYQR